jgi:hypothetical protein
MRRYEKLVADAKSEDFVRHHLPKYWEPAECLPIETIRSGPKLQAPGLFL